MENVSKTVINGRTPADHTQNNASNVQNKTDGNCSAKSPRRKLIGGIILLIVSSVLFAVFLFFSNLLSSTVDSMVSRTKQMEGLSQSVERVFFLYHSVREEYAGKRMEKMALEVSALRSTMDQSSDRWPCMTQEGAVIRVSDKGIDYPDDLSGNIRVNASILARESGSMYSFPDALIEAEPAAAKSSAKGAAETEGTVETKGTASETEGAVGETEGAAVETEGAAVETEGAAVEEKKPELYIVYYSQIEGPYYYIEWERSDVEEEKQKELFDINKAIIGIEEAFDASFLLFYSKPGSDGEHILYYVSDSLPDYYSDKGYASAEEYGITQDMLSNVTRSMTANREKGTNKSYSVLRIEDEVYEVYLLEFGSSMMEGSSILACFVPFYSASQTVNEQIFIVLAVFILIATFFLVWITSTWRLVRDHALNDIQKKELGPRAIARRSFSILVIGCVIILAVSLLFLALSRLYSACRQAGSAYVSMQQRIEDNADQTRLAESFQKKSYEGFALQIARILEENPEFAKADRLQSICDVIGADYIMLFDKEGNETVSNSRYVGLSLGKDPSSSTYDFRRLLTGTRLITHELATDEATGEENVMIGAGYGKNGEGENYCALLLAVPGDRIYNNTGESIDDVLFSLVAEGTIAYSVDPETALILHASDKSLIGKNALDLGLPERALHGGYSDFFSFNGMSCYGQCEEMGSGLYIYTIQLSHIYRGILLFSLFNALAALILLILLAVYAMFGYRKFFAVWSQSGAVLKENEDEIRLPGGRRKYSKDPSRRWRMYASSHGIHMPFHAAGIATEVLLMICIVILGVRVLFSGTGEETSLLSYIIRARWTKGFNLFAFTNILILLGEVFVVVTLIKLLLHLISNALGTKGETVCRLLINLTSYAGVLFFIYYALYYLGFQPSTLLASLGLMSFAVSLGAKDLITDIIAGLSIVFEGEFQVGDIIDVGGYRGEVLEIGVRTTKIEGRGGNIKIIGNRDIKNVINMTRMNSWCTIEISVSGSESLTQIEDLLNDQLPKIGERIPKIISGPNYLGITSIGRGTMTLSIVAECNEEDYYLVQRSLNHAIQMLFEEYGIKTM